MYDIFLSVYLNNNYLLSHLSIKLLMIPAKVFHSIPVASQSLHRSEHDGTFPTL